MVSSDVFCVDVRACVYVCVFLSKAFGGSLIEKKSLARAISFLFLACCLYRGNWLHARTRYYLLSVTGRVDNEYMKELD